MNYSSVEFYAKLEILDCKPEFNEKTNREEFRIFFPNGSCKSDILIEERGIQKIKIKPMGIDNKFFIRVTGVIKNKKIKIVNKVKRSN